MIDFVYCSEPFQVLIEFANNGRSIVRRRLRIPPVIASPTLSDISVGRLATIAYINSMAARRWIVWSECGSARLAFRGVCYRLIADRSVRMSVSAPCRSTACSIDLASTVVASHVSAVCLLVRHAAPWTGHPPRAHWSRDRHGHLQAGPAPGLQGRHWAGHGPAPSAHGPTCCPVLTSRARLCSWPHAQCCPPMGPGWAQGWPWRPTGTAHPSMSLPCPTGHLGPWQARAHHGHGPTRARQAAEWPCAAPCAHGPTDHPTAPS